MTGSRGPSIRCIRREHDVAELGALAANVLSRAVARAVYEARALPFPGALPAWRDKFSR